MDQKNTIVKCAMHKCLFNNCGTCDQYVITIGVDGKCAAYCETELNIKEQKVCHDDCIHFDDSDPKVGPMCLFRHPEPLKEFYDGMPCDYYHQKKYAIDEVASMEFKVAELNKPNKNKSTIKDVVPECDLPVCDWSCKHALRSGPSFNPELWCDIMKQKPAVGLFCSEYKEEKPIIKIKAPSEITFTAENAQWDKEFIADQMCWYCDHGKHGKCKFPAKPMRDSNGECCRFTSTGGNR